MVKETQQEGTLTGFVVSGSDRIFDWYNPDTVTELDVAHGVGLRRVRLAVSDRDRRVIRAMWSDDIECHVDLSRVAGLVRRHYGDDTYGHTEYYLGAFETEL